LRQQNRANSRFCVACAMFYVSRWTGGAKLIEVQSARDEVVRCCSNGATTESERGTLPLARRRKKVALVNDRLVVEQWR
jgi:hypothetical protein